MKNELDHIFQTYFSNNIIYFYGDASRVTKIEDLLNSLLPFDHPDAYAKVNDEVLIFEHFEFDSSANNKKKGSQQRRSESDENRAFTAIIPTEKGSPHHGKIAADYSIVNYKNNLKKVFTKHYNEIPAYKKTLQENGIITDGEKVTKLFFIEDSTILGNIFETKDDDKPWMPVILPLCDFFLDLFENSPDLDMALCASWYPSEYSLWYIDHSMIQEYREHEINTNTIEIINFKPQSIGVKITVPNV